MGLQKNRSFLRHFFRFPRQTPYIVYFFHFSVNFYQSFSRQRPPFRFSRRNQPSYAQSSSLEKAKNRELGASHPETASCGGGPAGTPLRPMPPMPCAVGQHPMEFSRFPFGGNCAMMETVIKQKQGGGIHGPGFSAAGLSALE